MSAERKSGECYQKGDALPASIRSGSTRSRVLVSQLHDSAETIDKNEDNDQLGRNDLPEWFDDGKRGQRTQSSSPAPRPQTQNDGKKPSKEKSPRGSRFFWEENSKSMQTLP